MNFKRSEKKLHTKNSIKQYLAINSKLAPTFQIAILYINSSQLLSLVAFLADLYIHGETTFEIQEQGKMKTVMVNPSAYRLSKEATAAFKTIHDEWEVDVCEKNPYDNLIGGKKPIHIIYLIRT